MGELGKLEQQTKQRADYYEIDHEKFGPPTQYRNYFDSIGYGVVIGLLWKITHSLDYLDIQLLQILIFALLMLLFYQIAFILFKSKKTALCSSIALLAFLPISYLNVQVFRDIWPYYASVTLAYTILAYLFQKKSLLFPFIGGSIVGLIQLVRVPTFSLVLASSIFLIFYAFIVKNYKRIFYLLLVLWASNALFFWIPFSTYNKIAYNRYFVGPTGINLIEGLGEFSNPWGYKLSDGWYSDFVNKTYGPMAKKLNLQGNQKWLFFDDKTKELALKRIKENPLFYFSCMARRIPRLLFPGLPWFNYQDTNELYLMYTTGTPLSKIMSIIFRSPIILIDFVARHIYIGLFLLFAYLGMLILFIRKKYFQLFFIFCGIIFAAYSVVLAHTDHRYLTPYFAFFSLFVGYFICNLKRSRTK